MAGLHPFVKSLAFASILLVLVQFIPFSTAVDAPLPVIGYVYNEDGDPVAGARVTITGLNGEGKVTAWWPCFIAFCALSQVKTLAGGFPFGGACTGS